MSTIAVGDIHGNVEALENLLTSVLPEVDRRDTLVFLGDYIDRGPDTRGCIDRILKLHEQAPCTVVALLGNHEQWMLRTLRDPHRHSWLLGMEAFDTITSYSSEAAKILRDSLQSNPLAVINEKHALPYDSFFRAVPQNHLHFFENLRFFHRTDDVTCTHAGVPLNGCLDTANADDFTWGPPGFPYDYNGKQEVVYGHWDNAVIDELGWPMPCAKGNCTFGIDTISSGVLTAMRFPERKVYQSKRFKVG